MEETGVEKRGRWSDDGWVDGGERGGHLKGCEVTTEAVVACACVLGGILVNSMRVTQTLKVKIGRLGRFATNFWLVSGDFGAIRLQNKLGSKGSISHLNVVCLCKEENACCIVRLHVTSSGCKYRLSCLFLKRH